MMTRDSHRPLPGRIVSAALLGVIRIYQRVFSPVLSVALGPNCGCRFAPTCSHYAADAVRTHGPILGSWLSLRRLARCTPPASRRHGSRPPPLRPRRKLISERLPSLSRG